MRRKLMIPCPQCEGGDSKYFYDHKAATCSYCGGTKRVSIIDHHKTLAIVDDRHVNAMAFINDTRFVEYLERKG